MASGIKSVIFKSSLTLIFLAILPGFSTFPYARMDMKVRKVIIDAGHGGHDPGNLGTGRYRKKEKDIALDVALMVGKYINENLPDVEVIYTRKDDRFIELRERTAIANREKADVFISIHCDAFTNRAAYGSSTFVMGKGRSESKIGENNMRVAMRENSVILLEENYEEKYDGFDPSKPETYIALSLYQDVFITQSIDIAQKVQDQFRDRVKRKDRGVKQQPLWVTSQTIMPSILIELGFLTNSTEEDFLNSQNGKELMSSAIYRAFKAYKLEREGMEKYEKPLLSVNEGVVATEKGTPETIVATEDDLEELANESDEVMDIPTSGERQEAIPDQPVFKIQIATTSQRKEPTPANFNGLQAVEMYQEKSLFKYVYGSFFEIDQAKETLKDVRKSGFPDAFVVAFHKGQKISIQEALKRVP